MSLPYYKFFPGEDLGNYQIMSLPHDALGVWYLLRICHLWQHKGRISDDPVYISGMLRLTVDQWEAYRALFLHRGMVQIIDGCVTVAAVREKWLAAEAYSEGQRDKRLKAIAAANERKVLKKGKKNR